MSAFGVTVVGEALVDVVHRPGQPVSRSPGGSPANVALGLARLGTTATLLTSIGADNDGRLVRDHLSREGVWVVDVGRPGARTSTATATVDRYGVASYRFDLSWDVGALMLPTGTAVLHVGSLGATLPPGDARVLELVRATAQDERVLISFDPNVRPSVTPDRVVQMTRVLEMAQHAHLIKCSEEDAAFLFPHMSIPDVAEVFLRLGCAELVMVTQGARGSFIATHADRFETPGVPVTVVDTVGAGDAYMAGLLSGLTQCGAVSPCDLQQLARSSSPAIGDVVRRATLVAALTCTRPGADPPTEQLLAGRATCADG